jgi:hypothetical protein
MHNCCRADGWVAVARRHRAWPADPGQLESVTSPAPSRSPQAKRQQTLS